MENPRRAGESRTKQAVVAVEVKVDSRDGVEVKVEVEAMGRGEKRAGVR